MRASGLGVKGDRRGQAHLSGHVSVSVCEQEVQEWRWGGGGGGQAHLSGHMSGSVCERGPGVEVGGGGGGQAHLSGHVSVSVCE